MPTLLLAYERPQPSFCLPWSPDGTAPMDPRQLKNRQIDGNPYAQSAPRQPHRPQPAPTTPQPPPDAACFLTEKEFQGETLRRFLAQGWLCYHTLDSRGSQPGFPDLVCAHPQRGILYLELKTARGRLSNDQERWLDTITLAGGKSALLRPSDLSTGGFIDQLVAGTWQWTPSDTAPAQ